MKDMSDSEIMDMIDGLNEEDKQNGSEIIKLKQIMWLMFRKIKGTITVNENRELEDYWQKFYEGEE
jgi:hypothetical protein